MIKEARSDCFKSAALLGDYQSMTCDELANGYCKAIDTENRNDQNKYLSALILRFWYTIDKMHQKCPGLNIEYDEFFMWLIESINYACKYRAWQDPKKHVNAQQAINQCINTIRLQHYYQYNLDKHKANYGTVSLDAPVQNEGTSERESSLLDMMQTPEDRIENGTLDTELIVQSYINDKKIIDAIIIDTIAFNDVEKHTKKTIKTKTSDGEDYKYTENYTEFWPYKLVQCLSNLPEDYKKYFTNKYNCVTDELEASLQAIRQANNQKLYKYLDACLNSLKHVILG